ncbi:MAG TPA: hypothetical protein VFA34_15075, partial [Actinomycetota bacterium]|nr:hypothetical protein [Actinomycetota bacterium]
MRQRIGIAFASLAVAMFGVALIASLNDSNDPDESSELSNPEPTGLFDDLQIDDSTPAPSVVTAAPKKATGTARRSSGARRTTTAAAPAPAPTEEPDGTIPPGYTSCNGNGADGSAGGGGGGCGGGSPGAAPPQQPDGGGGGGGDTDEPDTP